MSLPRLSYFGLRGRGEAIRLFLHATQTEFEDHRIESAEEWSALQGTLPFGGLPLYEAAGLRVSESHAILRHLDRTLTACSRDEASATERDATQEALAEAQEDYWRFAWVPNYYDQLGEYARETLTPRLRRLARWFDREGARGDWWIGDAFSYVDCIAYTYLDEVDAFLPATLVEFSELADFRSRVASRPGISEYLASGERPIVFGMGCMGPKIDPRISLRAGQTFASPWAPPLDLAAFLPNQRRLLEA